MIETLFKNSIISTNRIGACSKNQSDYPSYAYFVGGSKNEIDNQLKGFDMKTFTCANVPEGHFTFDELLELDLVKDAIQQLKAVPHPQKQKVKTLVFIMQYIDVVAAFDEAKNGTVLLGERERRELMLGVDYFVESNFDEIMKRFTKQQREILRNAVS